MFWLEVKVPGKKPTKKQEATMRKWAEKARAYAGWTTSPEDAKEQIMGLMEA